MVGVGVIIVAMVGVGVIIGGHGWCWCVGHGW